MLHLLDIRVKIFTLLQLCGPACQPSHAEPIWTSGSQETSCLISTLTELSFQAATVYSGRLLQQMVKKMTLPFLDAPFSSVTIRLWMCLLGYGRRFVQINKKSNVFGRRKVLDVPWLASAYAKKPLFLYGRRSKPPNSMVMRTGVFNFVIIFTWAHR